MKRILITISIVLLNTVTYSQKKINLFTGCSYAVPIDNSVSKIIKSSISLNLGVQYEINSTNKVSIFISKINFKNVNSNSNFNFNLLRIGYNRKIKLTNFFLITELGLSNYKDEFVKKLSHTESIGIGYEIKVNKYNFFEISSNLTTTIPNYLSRFWIFTNLNYRLKFR